MDLSIISKPATRLRHRRDHLSVPAPAMAVTEPRLTRRASLMLILLLSLGLWSAVGAIASAVLHWSNF